MTNEHINIYNNLIKLTRNKNLYINLKQKDTFSDRLIILLFHFAFFLKFYKNEVSKNEAQELFDYIIRQIELSIREIGYGDVSINKRMKEYVNLFYSILEKVEIWKEIDLSKKRTIIKDLLNFSKDIDLIVEYFDKYRYFLLKKPLKNFTKEILEIEI
tara:strand:- start:3702 stop:4175 length:474 start_codon:yes stop_codon:yes gene_type:complete